MAESLVKEAKLFEVVMTYEVRAFVVAEDREKAEAFARESNIDEDPELTGMTVGLVKSEKQVSADLLDAFVYCTGPTLFENEVEFDVTAGEVLEHVAAVEKEKALQRDVDARQGKLFK